MKTYIVTLTRTLERKVLVTAYSDDEADAKVLSGNYELLSEKRINSDSYDGWEYVKHEVIDCPLTCAEDIASEIYHCNLKYLQRKLYQYTACGMCAEWDKEKITLIGYVEGYVEEFPTKTLHFPFSKERFIETVEQLDTEAEKLWHDVND